MNPFSNREHIDGLVRTSHESAQRAVADLSVANVPEVDADVCLEKAIGAHNQLRSALKALEAALGDSLGSSSREQTDVVPSLFDASFGGKCGVNVQRVLDRVRLIAECRTYEQTKGKYVLRSEWDLVHRSGPPNDLKDLCRFSAEELMTLQSIGRTSVSELNVFLEQFSLQLRE